MSRRTNDIVEELVIDRLAGLVGGRSRRVDDGSADSMHDHEIDLPDGRTIAVEITGEVDDAAHATGAATRKHRLTDSGVTAAWDVSLKDWNTSRRELAKKLPSILTDFKDADRRHVTAEEDSRLASLGVAAVERHDDLDGPAIYLTKVGPARSIGPSDVLDAVVDHGTRADNVGKLNRATVDERHLALWVDITAGDSYVALNDFGLLPEEDPPLDESIDAVWAMRLDHTDAGPDIDIVWSWRRGIGWAYYGRSPTVLSANP